MDFTECEKTKRSFSGAEKKIGIKIGNKEYMLKFQKTDMFGTRYNHISEYLGSNIFSMLGVKSQNTILGKYGDKNVVACELFFGNNQKFVPFDDVGESSLDIRKEEAVYTYKDIQLLLEKNKKLTKIEETVETFWNIFIIDALLGNFDRHGANWGFIKKNDRYELAPVFDNGSCLYPKISDEDLCSVINSEEETNLRVYGFPTSKILLDGKKSSYFEVINSLRFEECNGALKRICPKIDMNEIADFVNSIGCISDIRKEFYIHMLKARYEKIILASYEKLIK